MNIKQISVILFYVMFLYSGYNKIFSFNKKVDLLQQKTGLPYLFNAGGMIGVILLEIIGSLIMIIHYFKKDLIPIQIVKYVKINYLLFLIAVTLLYHPPTQKMIPFLSNLTTFSGLLYMYSDL